MSSRATAFQVAFRKAVVHAGWIVAEEFSRDLHISCSLARGSIGICGMSIWETGALNDGSRTSVGGTLQATVWCRNESIEKQVSALFGKRFDNAFLATAERSLRNFRSSIKLDDFGLFSVSFDDALEEQIDAFFNSLLSAAQPFFESVLSGACFEDVTRSDVCSNAINWEIRTALWRILFSSAREEPEEVLRDVERRLACRIESDIERRASVLPEVVFDQERERLHAEVASCVRLLRQIFLEENFLHVSLPIRKS